MATMIGGTTSPRFEALWGNTINKDECYAKYEHLAHLEEELSEQGKVLSESDSQELLALADLVMRDQSSILCGRIKIEIGQQKYYYVQFQDQKILQLRNTSNTIERYLKINNLTTMFEAFETTEWYRKRVISYITVDYMDTLTALRSSHQFNMDALKIIKRLESLHVDIMTADIYPAFNAIFDRIFELYKEQKQFNEECNKQILGIIQHYDKLSSNQQEFVKKISQEMSNVTKSLAKSGDNFKTRCSSIIELTDKAFNKATQELARVAESSSDKVFITSLVATSEKSKESMIRTYMVFDQDKLFETVEPSYRNHVDQYIRAALNKKTDCHQIEAACSQPAVWIIEKVDKRMLNSATYALASISHSVKQIQSSWKTKFNVLDRKLPDFKPFLLGINSRNEQDFLEKSLSGISLLHVICIQNILHSKKIDEYQQREFEVFDRRAPRMQSMQSVFIQNSFSGKYLMCQEEEVLGKPGKRHNDSEVFLVPAQNLNDKAIWHLAKGEHEGSLIISNMVSKRYLIHSQKNVQLGIRSGTKVMGNPLMHIKDKSLRKEPDSKSILENTQMYEGLWKFAKIHDLISNAMHAKPKKLGANQVTPFSGNGSKVTIHTT